jgi:hypothetical protein
VSTPHGGLEEAEAHCPYCGEPIDLLLDASIAQQEYIEDCSVCCRPLSVSVRVEDGHRIRLEVRREDDV